MAHPDAEDTFDALRPPSRTWIDLIGRLFKPVFTYHQHRCVGLEHIPPRGPGLLVVNHSLATYDSFLLGLAIYQQRGRHVVGLGDDLIFKIPGLRELARASGIYPANPTHGQLLLERGYLLGVAPGGMKEALRPSSHAYQVQWEERKGFVRLALRAQVPIYLAACPAADDLYTVHPSPVTDVAYRRLKVPLPFVTGEGGGLRPHPVALTHHIAPPLYPPELDEERLEMQVDTWHQEVVDRMKALMEEALEEARGQDQRRRSASAASSTTPAAEAD